MSDRDTHFQEFAKLLWIDIIQSPEWPMIYLSEETIQQTEQLIAQRAYDLAYHTLKTAEEHDLFADNFFGRFSLDTEAKLSEIPDMTERPKPD